jgi:inositol phosphorylceramide mannosyltransferase catalytic subunit
MAIPKTIIQTFKTSKLPFITQWHIKRMKKRNPEYDYQFYDDARIENFLKDEFGQDIFELYKKINIGAAKADFFRYAILFKKGGVYLDIDSLLLKKLDDVILPVDCAIIALEDNLQHYVQWAMIFEAGHPFLEKTLEIVINNLKENKYPYDVHEMTGPKAYSLAIRECLKESSAIRYRQLGIDYDNAFKFSYPMSKFFLYGLLRKNHWNQKSDARAVLKDNTTF